MFQDYDLHNSNKYQEVTLRRIDNSENIFDEFIKANQHIIHNGKNNILIF